MAASSASSAGVKTGSSAMVTTFSAFAMMGSSSAMVMTGYYSGGNGVASVLVIEVSEVEIDVCVGEEAALTGSPSVSWSSMMSRFAAYHAYTFSSITSGFTAMRNTQSVFLFFSVVVVLSR
jgi:hypothetical protein